MKRLSLLGLVLLLGWARDTRPGLPESFATPEATVRSYWHSMLEGRHHEALDCFLHAAPSDASSILGLPDLVELRCRDFRAHHRGAGVVDLEYRIEYRVALRDSLASFSSGDRLRLTGRGWKIAQPLLFAAR